MSGDALNRALKPVARRIRLCRVTRALHIGLLMLVCAAFGWVGASFFWPIDRLFLKAGASSLALFLLPVLVAVCWPVQRYTAARAADQMGLQERTTTALTVSGDTIMHQLQREDATEHLHSLNVRAGLKPRPRKVELIVSGALALITAALLFVPSPQQGELNDMRAFEKKMEKLAEAAEQRERPETELPETNEQSAELRKLERDLLDQIRKSRTERAAYEALDAAEQRMNRLVKDAKAESAESTSSGTDSAEGEGAGKSGEPENEQEGEGSGESGQSVAGSMSGTGTGQSATGGRSSAQINDLSSLMNQLRQGVNSAAAQRASGSASGSQSAQTQSGNGQGQGKGQGQGDGQGQGQSPGEQGGSGAGLGTTNKDAGLGSQLQNKNSSGGGLGMPEHRVGQYESIYDPTRIDGTDDIHQAEGELNEGEISRIQLGPGRGLLEGDVPYDRVIGDYAPQAAKASDNAAISPGARQWVRDYFDSLID